MQSVTSLLSDSSVAEPSIFDRELPQGIESLAIELPRGLRTHGSCRIAGELRGSREVKVPTRKYSVTVKPGGHVKKAKDVMRETARGLTEMERDVERSKMGDAEVHELVDERTLFRIERLKRFQLGHHFPALVSPRLVPSWSLCAAGHMSFQDSYDGFGSPYSPSSARQYDGLTKETVSHLRKQQPKHVAPVQPPWLVTGAAGAADLISDRRPALHTEHYDLARHEQREAEQQSRELWVSDAPMLPTSVAAAKASLDPNRQHLDNHIAAMRERGRALNESLKARYDMLRQQFQKEDQARLAAQGTLSSFESALRETKRVEAAAQAESAKAKSVVEVKKEDKDTNNKPFASLAGLHLRKQTTQSEAFRQGPGTYRNRKPT